MWLIWTLRKGMSFQIFSVRRTKSRPQNNEKVTKTSLNLCPGLCTISAACPASLLPASLPISIRGTNLTAQVDSGSSESYINSNICEN